MGNSLDLHLSRRERQIMNALFRHGEASVVERPDIGAAARTGTPAITPKTPVEISSARAASPSHSFCCH